MEGLEDAPATAIRGEDMNVRAAVCIVGSVVGIAGWVGVAGGFGGVALGLGLGYATLHEAGMVIL